MLNKQAQEKVAGWIRNLQNGDVIRVKGNAAYIYNESGCELDNTLRN